MKTICFDTNIIVWGIQKNSTENRKDNIIKAEYLIKQCQNSKDLILIPSIVLSELFMALPIENHRDFYLQMSQLGLVVPYDARASFEYGKIANAKWSLQKEINIPRQKMKADMMIIATAIANKSTCIYSEDDDISKIGGEFIEVRRLPSISWQTEIPLDI